VAGKGYAGLSPDEFCSTYQRRFMLNVLSFLGMPEILWHDKVIVEVGSGPCGILEYIQAKKKYGV